MREFFKGWRRKVGLIALLAAFALAILWARTLLVADHIEMNVFAIGSARSGVYWVFGQPAGWTWMTTTEEEVQSNIGDKSLGEALAHEFSFTPPETEVVYGYLLYWWLVAPLTIFAAYLILWKPRPKPKDQPDA